MTNYAYTTGIPNGALTPSQNRPTMTQNNDSNNSIWNEDHNGFNDNVGGTHQFMRMPNFTAPAVISETGTQGSVVYTAAGVAANTIAQLFFKNPNATYHLSPVKAWAFCNGSAGGIVVFQSFNVSSVTRTSPGTYSVVMPANVVTTQNYAVLITTARRDNGTGRAIIGNYESQTATSFQVITIDPVAQLVADPFSFSFMVIQI